MKYNDLPEWAKKIVKQRAIENFTNEALHRINMNPSWLSLFAIDKTPEPISIWASMRDKNFKPLAEFHGIKLEPETPKQESQLKEVVNILQQNAYEIHECKRKLDYLINNIK